MFVKSVRVKSSNLMWRFVPVPWRALNLVPNRNSSLNESLSSSGDLEPDTRRGPAVTINMLTQVGRPGDDSIPLPLIEESNDDLLSILRIIWAVNQTSD